MAAECQRREIFQGLLASIPQSNHWHRKLTEIFSGASETATLHLAVMVEPYLSAILSGRKTIESRFGVHRSAPYLAIEPGDVIVFKKSAGPAVGVASAKCVHYYQLSAKTLQSLRDRFAVQLFATDEDFWRARAHKHFATLIEIEDALSFKPFSVTKRDRRGWVRYPKVPEYADPRLLA